jgi:Ni/Co efflux regulator RcnB
MTLLQPRVSGVRRMALCALAATALAGSLTGAAFAQPDRGGDHDRGQHNGWANDRGGDYRYRRGQRMGYNDWNNAPVVDYRQRHLRRPRAGYEWRERNGSYVMVAIATGLIASVLLNPR